MTRCPIPCAPLCYHCCADGAELGSAGIAAVMTGAAGVKARAAGRTSEPQEDRAALVQRRKKRRLQVRGAAGHFRVLSCHACLLFGLRLHSPATAAREPACWPWLLHQAPRCSEAHF